MAHPAPQLRVRLRSYVVIPARLASTRLPRKMLLAETGKPLIQHTYEAALQAQRPLEVIVAADDVQILEEVRRFGGQAELTDPCARSGTDRVAEVARRLDDAEILVNWQGDEPELPGKAVDQVILLLEDDPAAVMSTLAAPIRSRARLEDPACVKVVFDDQANALYFSRSPIPHSRQWSDSLLTAEPANFFQHIGLYAYRREFLLELAQLPVSALEQMEQLEQLRVLAAGKRIKVGVIDHMAKGIDTPEDYQAFVRRCRGH